MSSGANIGDGGPDGIGDDADRPRAWEKFQLGWLDAGRQGPVLRGGLRREEVDAQARPEQTATKQAAGAVRRAARQAGAARPRRAVRGRQSSSTAAPGDDLDMTMTHAVACGRRADRQGPLRDRDGLGLRLPRGLQRRRHHVDAGPDEPRRTAADDQNGYNVSGTGITGSTGGAWVDLTATVPAGTNASGSATGPTVAWPSRLPGRRHRRGRQPHRHGRDATRAGTFDGFRVTTGIARTQRFFNAYVAENRQYDGYDKSLRTAYNFGFTRLASRTRWRPTRTRTALLITLLGHVVRRQQRRRPPGCGPFLPVDAHPTFCHWPDGTLMRPRILSLRLDLRARATDAASTVAQGQRQPDAASRPSRPCRRSTTPRPGGSTATAHAVHRRPTRVATSRAGTASTCRRPARRSPSTAPPPRLPEHHGGGGRVTRSHG